MDKDYKVIRRVENNRLVYYMRTPNSEFWDEWSLADLTEASYANARLGFSKPFEGTFYDYIPQTGKILEAGCGNSRYVVSLLAKGYDIEGVEWGNKTIEAVKQFFPDLPIREGDVTYLDVPDEYYQGYLSLGVMEHRREGPKPYLDEAFRVLKPDGIALISVPCFNPLRQFKANIGFFKSDSHDLDFYQYAYLRDEFQAYLQETGFEILDWRTYGGVKGIKDEIGLINLVLGWPIIGKYLRKVLQRWRYGNTHLGHMMVFACRKPEKDNL
ncbi:MAG: class I SAM-dependent methyltransferase [Anaerolineae bacterium]|nr:class I SAM-dependent methyltransferase [Anaerolineae bacterium]